VSAGPEPIGATSAERAESSASFDVEVVGVVKDFNGVRAVAGVSFELKAGTFFALLGPSGCGKTTLLRMIAGFEVPTAGDIRIAGRSVVGIPAYRRHVNMVFQNYALFPHMDVAANVGYGPRRLGMPRTERDAAVEAALQLVRLDGYGSRRTWELSGGQQQRVALARALINRPTVLLLDEPLGALDLKLRREMQGELKRLQREVGITFVYVTHDQDEALSMADRIAVMRAGEVLQDGSPAEIYEQPSNRWVAEFVGQMNFFEISEAERDSTRADGWTVRTERGARVTASGKWGGTGSGEHVAVAIRPERVNVHPGPDDGQQGVGRVVSSAYLGDQVEVVVDCPALGVVQARLPNDGRVAASALKPGEEVVVDWDPDAARLVPAGPLR
jgi:spermidine/putrescine transport system ATP-binding protein